MQKSVLQFDICPDGEPVGDQTPDQKRAAKKFIFDYLWRSLNCNEEVDILVKCYAKLLVVFK